RDSDTIPFDQVLYGDILYKDTVIGENPGYEPNSNEHYKYSELSNSNLMTGLIRETQSANNGLPEAATAGVMTTRTSGENFYEGGTNRRINRFIFVTFLCKDYEELHDITLPHQHVGRDVERNPGGDSRTYLAKCVG